MNDTTKPRDKLTLKWGTLKGWHFHSDRARALLTEYAEIGTSMSAMMQKDTPRQKEIICELIDDGDFETVYLDWDGKDVSKAEAKKYVMEYGVKPPPAQGTMSPLTGAFSMPTDDAVNARRYLWLRRRMQIRMEQPISRGPARPAFSLRIGHAYTDTTEQPGRGYLDPARYETELAEVDAAIDTAIARERHSEGGGSK